MRGKRLALGAMILGCLLMLAGGVFALIDAEVTAQVGQDAYTLHAELNIARSAAEEHIGSMYNADGTPVTSVDALIQEMADEVIAEYPEADQPKARFAYALLPYLGWKTTLLIAGDALLLCAVLYAVLQRRRTSRAKKRLHRPRASRRPTRAWSRPLSPEGEKRRFPTGDDAQARLCAEGKAFGRFQAIYMMIEKAVVLSWTGSRRIKDCCRGSCWVWAHCC